MSVVPDASNQPQITADQFQQAVNRLVLLQTAMLICSPVHLSPAKSVSLARVELYGAVEVFDEKPAKGSDEPELVSKTPPEFKPAIWLASGEVIELETVAAEGAAESENEIFRDAWEQYAQLTIGARQILQTVFPEEVPAT